MTRREFAAALRQNEACPEGVNWIDGWLEKRRWGVERGLEHWRRKLLTELSGLDPDAYIPYVGGYTIPVELSYAKWLLLGGVIVGELTSARSMKKQLSSPAVVRKIIRRLGGRP